MMKFVALFLFILSPFSFAETDILQNSKLTPLYGIEIKQGYDDNVLSSSNGNELDSWVSVVSPFVQAEYTSGEISITSFYQAKIGSFKSSPDDDYIDQNLSVKSKIGFSPKSTLNLELGLSKLHDERGSVDSSESVDEPDKYSYIFGGGQFDYGLDKLKGNTGRIELSGKYSSKRFSNNVLQTSQRELDQSSLGAVFFYKAFSSTEALFEVSRVEYDYLVSDSDQDNHSLFYLIGLTWAKSKNTWGAIKFGQERKSFDKLNKANKAWDAYVSWRPRSYSTLTIKTESRIGESSANEDYSEDVVSSVFWEHEWKKRLSTELFFSHSRERLVSDDLVSSIRTTLSSGLSLNYSFNDWLSAGIDYAYSSLRYSNIKDATSGLKLKNYDRNKYMLSVSGQF